MPIETRVFTVKEESTGTMYHILAFQVVFPTIEEKLTLGKAGYRNPEKYLFLTILTPPPIVTYVDDWQGGMNCPAGLIRKTFQFVWNDFYNIENGEVINL